MKENNPPGRLAELLQGLFSVSELKKFLGEIQDGMSIIQSVSWAGSIQDIAIEVAQALARRGLIVRRLFEVIVEERPARLDSIQQAWKAIGDGSKL